MSIDTIDFSEFSYDELVKLQRRLDKAVQSYGKRRKKQALDELKAVATRHGFLLDDLMPNSQNNVKHKSAPKYRNPLNYDETWTGKGRKPKWVVEFLEAGGSLDYIEIP